MGHLISISDLSLEQIDALIATADDIVQNPQKYSEACKGKKLAALFFEPSTRTRLSFEAAMLELGGSVLGFAGAAQSSAAKGETVADTARMAACYADIMAIRHPLEGAPMSAALHSTVPVINAGDGGHEHPTQTLTDLLTITRELGRLNGLTIGVCGDLKYGRTVHSLVQAMARYDGVSFIFISPDELKMPDYVKACCEGRYREQSDFEAAMPELDVLYMTRIQRERFDIPEQYDKLKDSYILDAQKLKNAKQNMRVLHPLPRVNEISADVDDDPRAAYFRQALCGKHIRMALILSLLSGGGAQPKGEVAQSGTSCKNPKCVACCELSVKPLAKDDKCLYCGTILN